MIYRDVDALIARVAHLESERVRVRARAQRIWRAQRVRRLRRLAIVLATIVVVAPTLFFVIGRGSACACTPTRDQAKYDLRTIHPVAEKWRVDHGPTGCPTFERLMRAGEFGATSRFEDPWGHRYEIRCDGETNVSVASAGSDGRFGTPDDIVIPEEP